MESLRIVRLWAAAAWADGELHPSEAAALRRLIEASPELSAEQRQEAAGFLETDPKVDPAEVAGLSPVAREGVYRAALSIVKLDRKVLSSERSFLDRLRSSLHLDEEIVQRLESE